jgi:FtsZ-binding cell division protein ZapB
MKASRVLATASIITALAGSLALGQGGSGSSRVEPVLAHDQAMETMARLQKMVGGLQEKLDKLAQEPASAEIEKKMARLRRNMTLYSDQLSELERSMDTVYRNIMSEQGPWWDEAEPAGSAAPGSTQAAPSCPASCNCAHGD